MTDKRIEELEALRTRLENDIRRSRLMDANGLSRNSPLLTNFEHVKRDIANLKEEK